MTYPLFVPATAARGRIRPFGEDDIEQVAELHRSVCATAPAMSSGLERAYDTYFRDVFLGHPVDEPGIASLVYEESGRVVGFSGAVPVRMSFRGKPVLAKVLSQFIVDPNHRGATGVKILQAAFQGPQDLTIADESNSASRIVWQAIGGSTAPLQSSCWIYPLRPCVQALSFLAKKGPAQRLARVGLPIARSVDWLFERAGLNPFRSPEPRLRGEDMDSETLLALLNRGCEQPLCPSHDRSSLDWALHRATALSGSGGIEKVVLKLRSGSTVGWFLYHSKPGGLAEVLQVSAKRGAAQDVFDYLIHHADRLGAAAVSGRFELPFMESYVARRCLMRCGPWVLVHSRDRELTRAFQEGDVFYSRLEGEWVLHFRS